MSSYDPNPGTFQHNCPTADLPFVIFIGTMVVWIVVLILALVVVGPESCQNVVWQWLCKQPNIVYEKIRSPIQPQLTRTEEQLRDITILLTNAQLENKRMFDLIELRFNASPRLN